MFLMNILFALLLSIFSINPIVTDYSEFNDDHIVETEDLLSPKNVVEIDTSVHIESAMYLSSNLKFWKRYASYVYGGDDNVFTQGFTMDGQAHSDSFTVNVNGTTGFRYTNDVQHFLNNTWSSWNDPLLMNVVSFNFAVYRGPTDTYDYLTVIYVLGDGTSREIRMLDFDTGYFTGEFVSGINVSSVNNNVYSYYDAFVFANYTAFHQAYYESIDNYNDGYNAGYSQGVDTGYNQGYQYGYGDGYTAAVEVDNTASTIFTGILDTALIPVNVFLTIFNFEVFGINIAGIVSALLTISVVVIIFRFILGGKSDDK